MNTARRSGMRVVVVALGVLGPLAGCGRSPAGVVVQVMASAPADGAEVGEEELRAGVRITFDRPAAPPGGLRRVIAGPSFLVRPALVGEARWLDPRTLVFFPKERPRRSTAYEIRLASDLVLAPDLRAPDWKGIRFVHDRLAIRSFSLEGLEDLQPPRPTVALRASQPLDLERLSACGFVEKRADGGEGRRTAATVVARAPSDGGAGGHDRELEGDVVAGRALRLQPVEALAPATAYVLRCGTALLPAGGGEGLARPAEQAFRTFGPAGVRVVAPAGDNVAADRVEIGIEFATPMDPPEVRKHVSVRGPAGDVGGLELAADYQQRKYHGTVDLRPGTEYFVEIAAGLVDRFGQRLAGAHRHRFWAGDASPRLEAETGIHAVERSSGRYPMWARNLAQVEVRCARVPTTRLAAVLTGPANHDDWWYAASKVAIDWKALGLTVRTQVLRPSPARNLWHDQTLALGPTCADSTGERPAGLYLLELITDQERTRQGVAARKERRALINVTDLGLMAKVGNASSLVWVARLSSGAPVAAAEVQIRDLKGRVRFSGTTNADGVVEAPAAARLIDREAASGDQSDVDGEEAAWDYRGRRVLITARVGDDLAVLDTSWNDGIQNWSFGVEDDRQRSERRLRGFLHSDRGLYRPGDTVHLRGILRAIDRRRGMAVPRVRSGQSVHLVIEDPRGTAVEETDLALTAFGGFHRDLALSDEARLGDWRVRASLDGYTVSERFAVEEYRPRSFEVKVKAAQPQQRFLGQPLAFEVEASFLHGSPVREGKLAWSLRRRPHWPSFPGWESYVFRDFGQLHDGGDDWARDEERSFSDTVGDGELMLDAAGRARIEARDPAVPTSGPQDYVFEARVTDATGQVVAAGAAVTGHASDLYLGLLPAERVQVAQTAFAVQVVALDQLGSRRAAEVELTLTRRDYECGPGKGATGGGDDLRQVWGCQRKDAVAPAVRRIFQVPATGTATVERVVVTEPGEYLVQVKAPSAKGATAVASDLVYVVGQGDAYFRGDEGERMTLVASKARYRPGEVARLVPQVQLPGALALVTLERDGIISYRLRRLASSGEAIEIPIERAQAPNVFASVVLVRGRTGEGERGRPRFKMGVHNLEVDASDRRLMVEVVPERPSYRPGETVRATVRVRTGEGAPVRAELAVAAADEGVLQILGYRTPDPLSAFYAPFGLGTESATTWNRGLRMKDPSENAEEDGEAGGDAGGAEAGRVRARFMATAFWTPALLTGADGTAQVSFPAPDNLTAYRLMAVAADRGDRFGSGESRFAVNKPLQAVPALPRFLSLGDQAQAAVTLFNNGPAPIDVTVTLTAAGVDPLEGTSRTVSVPARGQRPAVFPVRATRAGRASFTFRAAGGGETDAVVTALDVIAPVVRTTELVVEGATAARIEAPVPAVSGALPDRSSLEVVVDRTGLARAHEGFEYLIEYPYGCLEQTTSKVVPMVALAELASVTESASEPTRSRAAKFVRAGLARVLRHQNDDGGFGLWVGASSELHYTAYALWGLEIARRAGHAVEPRAREEGLRYLKTRLAAEAGQRDGGSDPGLRSRRIGDNGARAFAHHVLAMLGQGDPGALAGLFERRAELPVFGRAFLLQALVASGRQDLARALADELRAALPGGTGPAIVKEEVDLDWYWSSDVRTTALVMLALLEISPGHAAIGRLAEGLLGARTAGRWENTQENVYGLSALAALARTRAAAPTARVTLSLGGKALLSRTLTGTAVEKLSVPLATAAGKTLVIEAAGGEVFYGARLQIERAAATGAEDVGLAIRRELLDPDTGASLQRVRLGQAVKVRLTVVSPTRLAHVAVVDRLPAGLEPVITRFARTRSDADAEIEPEPLWWSDGWTTAWQHQELRDDRMLVFADVLAAGESRHEYLARATTAGTFLAPPATTEAMYRPDIHGQSAAQTLVIER